MKIELDARTVSSAEGETAQIKETQSVDDGLKRKKKVGKVDRTDVFDEAIRDLQVNLWHQLRGTR